MRISAVIGANFGDEGKGLITDYLCANQSRSLVIRFNGGAQAGHTVLTPQGTRHVFHHIGSGALAGADTYLSRFFIVNPLLWKDEFETLKGKTQKVFIHPDALLSTPWDMLFNRALEKQRGTNRHGSCGVGIWETVLRSNSFYRTTARNLLRPHLMVNVKDYFVQRAKDLGVDLCTIWEWSSPKLVRDFVAACHHMMNHCVFADGTLVKHVGYENVVFEGAQGLLLDQDHSYSPYVSGSKTGLDNVKTLCEEMSLGNDVEAIYVTRSYLTRHGPGPFPTEDKDIRFADKTNNQNEWQGSLRFGHLNVHELCDRIRTDTDKMNVKPAIAITCLDQLPILNFLKLLLSTTVKKWWARYYSYGPTRNHVRVQ